MPRELQTAVTPVARSLIISFAEERRKTKMDAVQELRARVLAGTAHDGQALNEWDAYEDCSNLSFLSRFLFHPSCWFPSDSTLANYIGCKDRGLCSVTGSEQRGSELQAGIVLGCILLAHAFLLSASASRARKAVLQLQSGYEQPEISESDKKENKQVVGISVYAATVCLWCVVLIFANRGRGQLVGSVASMLAVSGLLLTAFMATKYINEPTKDPKSPPPKCGRTPSTTEVIKAAGESYGSASC